MSLYIHFLVCLSALTWAEINLKPYDVTAGVMFKAVDVNQDGLVSRNELDLAFKVYDSNGDGRVSRLEYLRYLLQMVPDPTLNRLFQATYDIIDVDSDSILDKHDFDNFFSLIDSNSDNQIDLAEYVRYWSVLMPGLETRL
ncbi:unnamed protein product [Lymnaea stagnalis]|uniref:EF-hand domain-containing protein n=1 Tax=Lymnaea stagnalis TaxID=6523 RepID=A0AAV2HSV7_LYMST